MNCVGVSKCAQVISGSFAYVVMTAAQFIMALCLLVLPLIVAVFCPDNTREEVIPYLVTNFKCPMSSGAACSSSAPFS